MSNIKILIIENEEASLLTLESILYKIGYTDLEVAKTADDSIKILQAKNVDLALVDIGLNGHISGIEVAKLIKDKQIPVIFITGFKDKETFEKAKEAKPSAYLVKPFNELTLEAAIDSAVQPLQAKDNPLLGNSQAETYSNNSIFVKNGRILSKIKYEEIIWIMSEGNYSIVNTESKKYAIRSSLGRICDNIPSNIFVRVHQRYIVQFDLIDKVNILDKELHIDRHVIPIGRSYKDGLLGRLKRI